MDKDLDAALNGLLSSLPETVGAREPGAYAAMASGKLIVSTDPDDLNTLEKSGSAEFGANFLHRSEDGSFRWIEVAGTKFFITYHTTLHHKYYGQKILWEIEKLLPGHSYFGKD
jgi:hypothetical protein